MLVGEGLGFSPELREHYEHDANLENFRALLELQKMLSTLDSRRREEMQELASRIVLPPYVAPEGCGVVVNPDYGFVGSREVPLDIEVAEQNWEVLSTGSDRYKELAGPQAEYGDPYFVGKSVERTAEGAAFAYSDDRQSRVRLTTEVTLTKALV